MPTKGDFYSETIRRALTAPDAGKVAEATLNTWNKMEALIAPIIGTKGVEVLFNRSLQLTSRTFPCLVITKDHEESTALLASLKANLAASDTNDAMEAGHALLLTFTELLSTLIGDPLTKRLLSPVWTLLSPISEQETKS